MTDKLPKEFRISQRVRALVGFKDGHVDIRYDTKIPLVGELTLRLERADIPAVERVLAAAKEWTSKSEIERYLKGAD